LTRFEPLSAASERHQSGLSKRLIKRVESCTLSV